MKNSFAIKIIKLLIFALIIGGLSATIDYLRIKNAEKPMFCLKKYNQEEKIETYTSLLYTAERKVRKNINEPLYDSKNIKYELFGVIKLSIPDKYFESTLDKKLNLVETENCSNQSKLYFADEKIKVYTYCLDEIEINSDNKTTTLLAELKNDSQKELEKLKNQLFLSKYNPGDLIIYETNNNDLSSTGLIMYQCDRQNINDIYIGNKNMTQQPDFCTYKDDDFKFIYEIIEEEHQKLEGEDIQPEVFYEDENYRYEFSEPKSNYIYLVTPAVRGKEVQKYPLMYVLNNSILTIDELAEKGLEFNKISKNESTERNEPTENN